MRNGYQVLFRPLVVVVSDELQQRERLDAEQCLRKAEECRMLASAARNPSHKIMLLHMAETWERVAKTYSGH
jgi:hypothetical protein